MWYAQNIWIRKNTGSINPFNPEFTIVIFTNLCGMHKIYGLEKTQVALTLSILNLQVIFTNLCGMHKIYGLEKTQVALTLSILPQFSTCSG